MFCDQRAKGYILLRLTPEQAVADYVAMATIYARGRRREAPCALLRRGRRRHSGEGVTQAGGDVRDNSPGRTGVGMNFLLFRKEQHVT